MDEDLCIICNPDPANLILKEERGVVLLDDPVRVGHVLVGASEHIDGLHALPAKAAADTLALAAEMAATIVENTGAEKVYVVAVGDKDKHFHVHLVPRYPQDAGLGPFVFGANGWVGTFGDEPSDIDAESLYSKLKGNG